MVAPIYIPTNSYAPLSLQVHLCFFLKYHLDFYPMVWCFILFYLFILIFIYSFTWLSQVFVAPRRLLSCGMQTLSYGMHVGSSSLTRDQTRAPCIGRAESYPLHHQGNPPTCAFYLLFHYSICLQSIFPNSPHTIAARGLFLQVCSLPEFPAQ